MIIDLKKKKEAHLLSPLKKRRYLFANTASQIPFLQSAAIYIFSEIKE